MSDFNVVIVAAWASHEAKIILEVNATIHHTILITPASFAKLK